MRRQKYNKRKTMKGEKNKIEKIAGQEGEKTGDKGRQADDQEKG